MLSAPGSDIKTLAQTFAGRYPHLRRALRKAADLISRSRIWCDSDCPLLETAYLALSSDGKTLYQVIAGHCTCPARGVCYHRVARRLCERYDQGAHIAPSPQPQPKPRTIKQDQRAMGEHLRRKILERPTGATLH